MEYYDDYQPPRQTQRGKYSVKGSYTGGSKYRTKNYKSKPSKKYGLPSYRRTTASTTTTTEETTLPTTTETTEATTETTTELSTTETTTELSTTETEPAETEPPPPPAPEEVVNQIEELLE